MRYYASLGLKGVAVKSPGDPQEIVRGWTYVTHPNQPLGAKWNRGLQEIDDDVMIVGSDDFVSEAYIDRAVGLLKKKMDVIQMRGLYILDGGLYWCYPSAPGAGRVISKAVIEKKKHCLWEDGRNRYLDASATTRLQKGRLKKIRIDEPGCVVLDVKTSDNLWRLRGDRLYAGEEPGGRFGSVEERPISELREHFPEWVIEGSCSLTC